MKYCRELFSFLFWFRRQKRMLKTSIIHYINGIVKLDLHRFSWPGIKVTKNNMITKLFGFSLKNYDCLIFIYRYVYRMAVHRNKYIKFILINKETKEVFDFDYCFPTNACFLYVYKYGERLLFYYYDDAVYVLELFPHKKELKLKKTHIFHLLAYFSLLLLTLILFGRKEFCLAKSGFMFDVSSRRRNHNLFRLVWNRLLYYNTRMPPSVETVEFLSEETFETLNDYTVCVGTEDCNLYATYLPVDRIYKPKRKKTDKDKTND